MSNFNNKPNITGDDVKTTKDYTNALDKLHDSLTEVNSALPSFADGMNAGLKAMAEKLPEVISSITKLNMQNKELASNGQKPISILTQLRSSLFSWNTLLSVGITLLTTFSGEIIKWALAYFKGKDAIDQAKLSLNTLNKALADTNYAQAIKQVDELRINVNLAKNGFIDKQFVLKQYNDSLGESMGKVKTLNEVENKLTKNGTEYIKMTLLKASAQLALQDSAKKAYEAEQDKLKTDDDSLTFWDKVIDVLNRNAGASGEGAPGIQNIGMQADKEKKEKAAKRRKEMVKDADDQKKALLNVAESFQHQAADIAKAAGFDFFTNTIVDNNSTYIAPKQPKPLPEKARPAAAVLEAKSITFSKSIDLDKQHYDQEMAMLNTQLANKLITQQQYEQASNNLQEKYHLAIGEKVRTFSQTELDEARQHMQDLYIIQTHDETMAKDEHDAKKALMPADKLNAEKQLITDKYNYEIALARGNTEKIKQLEDQKQQDITELAKNYEEQRKEFALQTAQKVSDAAFSVIKGNIQAQSDAKIKGLETQKEAELNNSSLTATQRKAIEDKYKKKEAEEKTKAFKAEQRASILQAVINGALAITKATSQAGILAPFVIPGIIAETAIQVATIAAQKAPQYAKGGLHYLSDGKGALLPGYSRTDNTNAYLRSGEAVVVSEAMRNPWARNLVSAINVAHGGRDFSTRSTSRGYAIGGIFTDGGNANRYYSQPANDVKDLANTLAYQMINNFPPIYVDVKDVNNQQNILAQTVNRVDL